MFHHGIGEKEKDVNFEDVVHSNHALDAKRVSM